MPFGDGTLDSFKPGQDIMGGNPNNLMNEQIQKNAKAEIDFKKKTMEGVQIDPKAFRNEYLAGNMKTLSDEQKRLQGQKGTKLGPEAQLNMGAQDQVRAQQMQYAQMLQQQAQGQGPSVAGEQFKIAQDQLLKQQMALAASQRGGSATAGMRSVLQNQAAQAQGLAQNVSAMRAQEAQAAQQQLGNVYQGMRSQDVQVAQANAQLQAEQRIAQGQLTSQELQQKNALMSDLLKTGITFQQAEVQANKQLAAQQAQIYGSMYGANLQAAQQDKAGMMGLIGSGLGAIGMLAMSDKRQKTNIKDTNPKEIGAFLAALKAQDYEYIDPSKPGTGKGQRHGIMAQDLEKTKIGKSLVIDTPQGKMVDTSQGFGVVLAALSDINKRLKKEGK
jgi:hypothetical protein